MMMKTIKKAVFLIMTLFMTITVDASESYGILIIGKWNIVY